MAAEGNGGIDGPMGPIGPYRKDDEEHKSGDSPSPSPPPDSARPLKGRVSHTDKTKEADHIIIGGRRYRFPIESEEYEMDVHLWSLTDLFRMTPPFPTQRHETDFDFRAGANRWVEAHKRDLDIPISKELHDSIKSFFFEKVTDKEERTIPLKDFGNMRPEQGTETQFTAIGAEVVAGNMHYVSFEEFLDCLKWSIEQYISFLRKEFDSGRCNKLYFVLPTDTFRKSNSWVARLAYPEFVAQKIVPAEIITLDEFQELHEEDPHCRGVTFDDCSYSGSQLAGCLEAYSVDLLVPFCTKQAEAKILSVLPSESFMAPFTVIETLQDKGLRKLELICTAKDSLFLHGAPGEAPPDHFPSRTLVYFEHKSADEISTLAGFQSGCRFPFDDEDDLPTGIDGSLIKRGTMECYKRHMGIGISEYYPSK